MMKLISCNIRKEKVEACIKSFVLVALEHERCLQIILEGIFCWIVFFAASSQYGSLYKPLASTMVKYINFICVHTLMYRQLTLQCHHEKKENANKDSNLWQFVACYILAFCDNKSCTCLEGFICKKRNMTTYNAQIMLACWPIVLMQELEYHWLRMISLEKLLSFY